MDFKEVPYIVHESAEARHERTEKRLTIALAVAAVALAVSNAAWALIVLL